MLKRGVEEITVSTHEARRLFGTGDIVGLKRRPHPRHRLSKKREDTPETDWLGEFKILRFKAIEEIFGSVFLARPDSERAVWYTTTRNLMLRRKGESAPGRRFVD